MPRRRNGRYIPTVSPTDLGRQYIPTDFKTELCPSVNITDGHNFIDNSVGFFRFSGNEPFTDISAIFLPP
jgi:hypothetical protein